MMFRHVVVLKNPISTEAHRAEERITQLTRLLPEADITVLNTHPGGRDAHAQILLGVMDKLGPHSLLCIAAGDGTVSMTVDALLYEPGLSASVRRTPILPLWCGNANDLAWMLNGGQARLGLRRAVRQGRIVPIRPLKCQLFMPDGSQRTVTAACYASFGATAFAAWELERQLRRKSPMRQPAVTRLGQEMVAASRALLRAPTFTIRETRSGRQKRIFERIFLNGSRFAKIIGVPLRLTDEQFHRATVERKDIAAILFHLVGIATGSNLTRVAGVYDAFTLYDAVWAQFDGEASKLPAGTHVEVSLGRRPFYALSSRLRKHAAKGSA